MRDAGLTADPIYVARVPGKFDTRVPGFSRFEDMKLSVAGDNFQAIYDPEAGTLTEGKLPVLGRVTWKPLDGGSPAEEPEEETALVPSYFEVMLDVEPDKDNGWKGTGHLRAGGLFCPYGEMKGLEDESLDYIEHLAGSLVAGADVSGYNPDCFTQDLVVVGFQFSAKAEEPDDLGRTRVRVGGPAGGIINRLPADVSLYDETRESPVLLPGCMDQRIRVRVKTGGREIVYLPDSREFSNGAGSYSLAVEKENGWVTIDQRLRLDDATVAPGGWPDLRALLLEGADVSGRTILIR